MMLGADLSILSWGLATVAEGDSRAQAKALVSGRPLHQRHPRWVGRDGAGQVMCWAQGLRDHVDFASRVALLAQRAWSACRDAQIQAGGTPARAGFILALPLTIGFDAGLRDAFPAAAAKLNFEGLTTVQFIFGEHAVGLAALERAAHLLSGPDTTDSAVYVIAVDSLSAPMMLDQLANQGALRDAQNPWNPVPSEAAVCMLVARARAQTRDKLPLITALSSEMEDMFPDALLNSGSAELDCQPLANCARASLSRGGDPARIVSDASGLRWRAEELAQVLDLLAPASAVPLFTAAKTVGDVGAATALLSIVLGLEAGPGDSLILASERSGSRRTAIVHRPASLSSASAFSAAIIAANEPENPGSSQQAGQSQGTSPAE